MLRRGGRPLGDCGMGRIAPIRPPVRSLAYSASQVLRRTEPMTRPSSPLRKQRGGAVARGEGTVACPLRSPACPLAGPFTIDDASPTTHDPNTFTSPQLRAPCAHGVLLYLCPTSPLPLSSFSQVYEKKTMKEKRGEVARGKRKLFSIIQPFPRSQRALISAWPSRWLRS